MPRNIQSYNASRRAGVEVVGAVAGVQPDLVELYGDPSPCQGRGSERLPWSPATLLWWESLPDHPGFQGLTQAQWFQVAGIALLHNSVAHGNLKHATELRQSLSAYALSPADLKRAKVEVALTHPVQARGVASNPLFEQFKAVNQ